MGVPGCALSAVRAAGTLLLGVVLVLAIAAPASGGKLTCSLQATVGGGSATEVEVGEEVLIEGTGFPALSDVEISYSVGGAPIGTETVTSDATGFFETTVIPAAGQEGLWDVSATDVEDLCTADTGFLVVGGPTPSPSPTASPVTSQLPNAAAEPHAARSVGIANLVLLTSLVAGCVAWTLARRALARRMR